MRNNKKTNNENKERGITLVALIVTIILMLILAGITISLVIGEDGILSRTQEAGKKWNEAEDREQSELAYLEGTTLPENTKETEAGSLVKMPEGWYSDTVAYYSIPDGELVTKSKKIATVYAVSDGLGNTVPIPEGFWYVGGNLDTGIVISDEKADQNKYAKEENGAVPSGVKVEDGEFVDELVGNQFVWIPCSVDNYAKHNWGQGNTDTTNCYWGTETPQAEKMQIEKYGGFYVGRYEAGLPIGTTEFTGNKSINDNVYNDIDGTPQSKAGRLPWNFVNWDKAVDSAQKMYASSTSVRSGLITDTQWDVMIQKVESKEGKNLINSISWGNIGTGENFNYTGRAAQFNYSNNTLSAFGNIVENATKTTSTYCLLSTGASESHKSYNLYDIGGNLFEWTEASVTSIENPSKTNILISTQSTNKMFRGGFYRFLGTSKAGKSACGRLGNVNGSQTLDNIGFRVVLYIK